MVQTDPLIEEQILTMEPQTFKLPLDCEKPYLELLADIPAEDIYGLELP